MPHIFSQIFSLRYPSYSLPAHGRQPQHRPAIQSSTSAGLLLAGHLATAFPVYPATTAWLCVRCCIGAGSGIFTEHPPLPSSDPGHCPAWALELWGWQHIAWHVLATASQVLDTLKGEVLNFWSLRAELLVLSRDWGPGIGNHASVTQLRGLESCSWLGYCKGLWREMYCVFF